MDVARDLQHDLHGGMRVPSREGVDVEHCTRTGAARDDLAAVIDAAHVGTLLRAARARAGKRLGRVAKASGGRFKRSELRHYERGIQAVDGATMSALAELYGCDLRAALPPRRALEIEHDRMLAGGLTSHFDPADHTTMLPAYERLVRTLRDVGPDDELDLRRPDVQVVGTYWAQCMMEQVHERVMSRLPSPS